MGKVLEALRKAERKNRFLKETTNELHTPYRSSLMERPRPETEDQMAGLFYAIESLLPSPGTKTIQFIGSELGDGASTVACVFAQTVAYRLNKVLLLFSSDVAFADSRRLLPPKNVRRLDDIMEAVRSPDTKGIQHKEDANTLYVSVFSSKGTEEADTDQTSDLWDTLKERFDMILIDSPPLDLHPDGLVVARKVDGTILVVRAEKTRWPHAVLVKEKLERQGANILGAVFNDQRLYLPKWLSAHLRM